MAEVKPFRPKKSLFYSCLTMACEGRRLASGFLLDEVWKCVESFFDTFLSGSFTCAWGVSVSGGVVDIVGAHHTAT